LALAAVTAFDRYKVLRAARGAVFTDPQIQAIPCLWPITHLSAPNTTTAFAHALQLSKDRLSQIRVAIPCHDGNLWNIANDSIQPDPGVHLCLDAGKEVDENLWFLLGVGHVFALLEPSLDPSKWRYLARVDLPMVCLELITVQDILEHSPILLGVGAG